MSPDYATVIETADGAARLVVPAGAAPELLEIRFEELDLDSIGSAPPGTTTQTVLAIDVTTFRVGTDTPAPTTYNEGVELWLQLPEGEESACEEDRAWVYHVESDEWTLVEHRCETDDSGQTWTVSVLTHFSTYTLVVDPVVAAAAATPAPAAVPTAEPTAQPAASPTPAPPVEEDDGLARALVILLGIGAAIVLFGAIWLIAFRRRRPRRRREPAR